MNNNLSYRQSLIIIYLGLIVVTFIAFWQVQTHEFVNYDDYRYVIENQHVQAGLTGEGFIWAFKNLDGGFWQPLTWLSHMLDCELYGLNPKGHHFNNLLLHIANTILLFLVLQRMTNAIWKSAFIAALFALHPLHVEPVAWVSGRKDVLSTLFFMITLWTYVLFAERPNVIRYLAVLLFFTLGLMAKSMIITLPFILLLLDYWPLSRFQFKNQIQKDTSFCNPNRMISQKPFSHLILEKVPLLILSIIFVILTFIAESHVDALPDLESFPLKTRIANAIISYVSYIGKMFFPKGLSVIYLHPLIFPIWKILISCIILICISIFVIYLAKSHPFFLTGWLWYLITLIPVIGLIQIGSQSMADRYTYIPLIGLFLMVAWGAPKIFFSRWVKRRVIFLVSAIFILLILIVCTKHQAQVWQNSVTLFEHAIEIDPNNVIAHKNLGFVLLLKGNRKKAIYHLSEAVRIKPDFVSAHYSLANAFYLQNQVEEAIYHYQKVIQINPNYSRPYYHLGNIFFEQGKTKKAINYYLKSINIDPNDAKVHNNLGLALKRDGRIQEALYHFQEALKINPSDMKAHQNIKKLQE
jgi:tetratricopeptide (TPR) repeat protein